MPPAPIARYAGTRERHELTHNPPMDWCPACMMGQDKEKPHQVPIELLEREPGRPVLTMYICFMECAARPADVAVIKRSAGYPPVAGALAGGDEFATTVVVVDKDTGSVRAFGAQTKQVFDFLVQGVIDMMNRLHLRAAMLASDNKPTTLRLKAAIRDARGHPTALQESPVRDSNSNGSTESSIRWWQGKARIFAAAWGRCAAVA